MPDIVWAVGLGRPFECLAAVHPPTAPPGLSGMVLADGVIEAYISVKWGA